MTTSRFPEITDELLSAYIDNAVTDSERTLVERAAGEDAMIAWRLATLRETVQLLRALPLLQAPRSFVLTPELAGQKTPEPAVGAPLPRQHTVQPNWWEQILARWREFWQTGNPAWRNALATSMAALLVLLVLPALLREPARQDSAAAPAAISLASEESAPTLPQAAASATESSALADTAADSASAETVAKLPEAKAPAADAAGDIQLAATYAPATANSAGDGVGDGAGDAGAMSRSMTPTDETSSLAAPATAAGASVRTIPGAESAAVPAELAAEAAAPVEAAGLAAVSAASESLPAAPAAAAPAAAAVEEAAADVQSTAMPLAAATEQLAAAPVSALDVPPAPTAAPSPTAAATQVVAFAEPDAPVPATSPPAVSTGAPAVSAAPLSLLQLMPWLQVGALAAVGAFGLLWWRSRRSY